MGGYAGLSLATTQNGHPFPLQHGLKSVATSQRKNPDFNDDWTVIWRKKPPTKASPDYGKHPAKVASKMKADYAWLHKLQPSSSPYPHVDDLKDHGQDGRF